MNVVKGMKYTRADCTHCSEVHAITVTDVIDDYVHFKVSNASACHLWDGIARVEKMKSFIADNKDDGYILDIGSTLKYIKKYEI